MNRKIQIIIFLFSSLVCVSQPKPKPDNSDIVGTWKYNFLLFGCKLTIKSDYTYEYHVAGDLTNDKSQGTWVRKKNKIILNSSVQHPPETQILSEFTDTIEGVRFIIKDNAGHPISLPYLKIRNRHLSIDTLCNSSSGVFSFERIKKIKAFKISHVGLKEANWSGNSDMNYFEIKMAPESDNYIYQHNEVWELEGKRLYSPSSRNDYKAYKGKNKNRINYFVKEKEAEK